MAMTATAGQIANAATQELGLPSIVLFQSSDDQVGYQCIGLLNSLGDELVRAHDWQFLEKTQQYTGDGIQNAFPLPLDFGRIVNQTVWSASMRRPMYGPLNAQQWGWCQFGIVSVGVYYRYRILGNELHVFPTPALNETIDFFYISRNWVSDHLVPTTFKDTITHQDDTPVFDRRLMITGLKDKLWGAKGLDNSIIHAEFMYMLEAEKGQNQGAPVIALDRSDNYMYIDWRNIPDGGWNA